MELKLPTYVKITLILLGIALVVGIMQTFKSVLVPLAFALLIALLLLPLIKDLERSRVPRPIAILLCIFLIVIVVGGVFWFFSMQVISLTSELDKIGNNIGDLVDKVQMFLYNKFGIEPFNRADLVRNAIGSLQDITATFLGNTISMTTGALMMLVLMPIFVFCFLYYRDHLQQFIFMFVPKDRRSSLTKTVANIQRVVQSYISALMIVIFIVALLNSAGLLLLGVKYAIFFGVFAAILTIIPYIGILIGALLPALITLATTGHTIDAILVVAVFMFVQFLEGNFITPYVVGSRVSINPFAAIVGLLIGGEIWGAAGMILSIPFIAMLRVMFELYPPLAPFGFLLADIDEVNHRKHGKLSNWLSEIWNGIWHGKKKKDS